MALFAGAWVLYTGLDAWFVADDFWYVVYVEQIKNPWSSFLFPQFGKLCFKPVTFVTSFYLDRALNMSPRAIHLSSLFLHLINVALLFCLVFALFRRADENEDGSGTDESVEKDGRPSYRDPAYPALAAAFIYAVHPVAALTATWYSCRADLLGTMFSLAALICVVVPPKPRRGPIVLSGLFALLAMQSKAPYMTVFITAFIFRFAIERSKGTGARLKQGLYFTLPLVNAFLIYVCWRFLVLRSFGGYVPLSESASKLGHQAAYHVPLVMERAFRDFFMHNLPPDHAYVTVLIVAFAALVVFGGLAVLLRGKGLFMAGLLFCLVSIVPLWNLSHMLVRREDRLLYLSLAGFAIVIAAVVHAPKSPKLRVLCLAAVLAAASVYGLYSKDKLRHWKTNSFQDRELADTIAGFMERQTPQASGERVYVLGPSSEHYYLDAMVKSRLELQFQDKLILSAEHDVFVFMSQELKERIPEPRDLPEDALPKFTANQADPTMFFKTAEPPDPLSAVHYDKDARVLEVKENQVKDLTAELRRRFHRRRALQRGARLHPFSLPSFGFVKKPMGMSWEVSGNAEVIEPERTGAPYIFQTGPAGLVLDSPGLSFHALSVKKAVLEMRLPEKAYLPPGMDRGCLRWREKENEQFHPKDRYCFDLKPDGEVHVYELVLEDDVHWAMSDAIDRLRLEPVYYETGVELFRLEFLPPEKE